MTANIIFGKLLRNQSENRRGGTPLPRSPRGTPSSSNFKGKRPASTSPSIALGGSSKKSRPSPLSTPPSGSSRPSLGLPPVKDERGIPLRVSRASFESLHSLSSLEAERGGNLSLVHSLMRGVLSPIDKQLLAPLSMEELEGVASSFLLKVSLELGYWADRLSDYKKSEEFQAEVAIIAGLYFEHGFTACKEQFLAQGYPPEGEEPSFLDLGTTMENAPKPLIGS
ncbi:UNVERIFIED_CONTAM: hypothetical protein Slati_3857100 [Sesamum latifolium]|uniref:Uncharacterized protein n=1 Tax=Sesamum latifolium TaxID=2727402 RepID=A0AAW2TLE0_9LAMI